MNKQIIGDSSYFCLIELWKIYFSNREHAAIGSDQQRKQNRQHHYNPKQVAFNFKSEYLIHFKLLGARHQRDPAHTKAKLKGELAGHVN